VRPLCYVCEQEVVPASGYSSSDVLIIGEFPGKWELKYGKPFVSLANKQTAGSVLRQELADLGYDLFQFRVCNLWWHEPNKNEACFEASKNACLDEAKGKKAILLIGSETVGYFTEYKVSDVSGLQVDSPMLGAPIIYACLQPATVFKGRGVGEVRFALKNFTDHIKKEGLI